MIYSTRSQSNPNPRPSYCFKPSWRYRSSLDSKLFLIAGLICGELILQPVYTPAQPLGDYIPPSNVGTPTQTNGGSTRAWTGGTYIPPSRVGTPTQTSSGSSRGTSIYMNNPNCPVVGSPLALIPINAFGVTLKSHPTFLFYVPATRPGEESPMVEYSLQDTVGNEIYKTRFVTNGRAGLASLTLPQGIGFPGLILEKDYYWSVSVICQGGDRIRDLVIQGSIRRVPVPTALVDLASKTPDQQANLLWQESIWYDVAALLGELQKSNAVNAQPNFQWQALMKAVELDEIINQPFFPNGSVPTSATSLPR